MIETCVLANVRITMIYSKPILKPCELCFSVIVFVFCAKLCGPWRIKWPFCEMTIEENMLVMFTRIFRLQVTWYDLSPSFVGLLTAKGQTHPTPNPRRRQSIKKLIWLPCNNGDTTWLKFYDHRIIGKCKFEGISRIYLKNISLCLFTCYS